MDRRPFDDPPPRHRPPSAGGCRPPWRPAHAPRHNRACSGDHRSLHAHLARPRLRAISPTGTTGEGMFGERSGTGGRRPTRSGPTRTRAPDARRAPVGLGRPGAAHGGHERGRARGLGAAAGWPLAALARPRHHHDRRAGLFGLGPEEYPAGNQAGRVRARRSRRRARRGGTSDTKSPSSAWSERVSGAAKARSNQSLITTPSTDPVQRLGWMVAT